MTNNINAQKHVYDLEERTAKFAEKIIELSLKTVKNSTTLPVVSQLVRSGTSIISSMKDKN